jgi:hypothetical protein
LFLPLSTDTSGSFADTFSIKSSGTLQTIEDTSTTYTIMEIPLVIQINSDMSFHTFARYFLEDGTAIGSGSLPPMIGKTTTYRVFWEIRNHLHDLEKGSLSMSLPQNVLWQGTSLADMGILHFDETTRLVTWTIEKLPKTTTRLGAWFDISITPSISDRGTYVKLTNPVAFQINDTITKDTLHVSSQTITSEIPEDTFANGKGVVLEESL